MTIAAHRAALVHFVADPSAVGDEACEYFEDGLLVVERGRVIAAGPAEKLLPQFPDVPISEYADSLIAPGFVDTHIHFPQTDVVAAYGADLLEWLEKHTFPAEERFADVGYAEEAAAFFLDSLMAAGTTTALVFATVHRQSAEAFFAEAASRNLRMLAGKVLMDRNAPPALLDDADSAYTDSRALIEKWHGHKRLGYAVTPRFAPTSSPAQLAAAGKLLRECSDLHLHTHLSENRREIEWVKALFPDAAHYLDVYDRHGLLRRRSVFAHGVHLTDGEWRRLAETESSLAHCPMSNAFLGSGLFDFSESKKRGVRVGLGTDVGGGAAFSMFRVMDEAYKTARLRGGTITPLELWHRATLGGAEALNLEDNIGNFVVGKEADFTVFNLSATPLLARRLSVCKTAADKLFALAILGDERAVRMVYIMGNKYEHKA